MTALDRLFRIVLQHTLACANLAADQFALLNVALVERQTHATLDVQLTGHFLHVHALNAMLIDIAATVNEECRFIQFQTQDDRHEYCAFEIDSNSSIPVVIRDGRAPTLALRAISRPTNAATVPLPGVSFQIQIASSLPWIDSDESFGALCVELDAVLLRAPLTLFALELNGALRFESHSHQIADEALFNRVSCSGLVSGAAMRAAMLPPTSRVVVEPFAGGRAYPFNASVTVIIHQTADIAVAAPFAIEFFSRGAPACGVLADAAHRAALSSALSQFSNHGVSFRLLNAAESVAEPQLFAHYRDESGAQIVGLVPGCAVEVVVDLHASASLLPSRLYGGDLFGVVRTPRDGTQGNRARVNCARDAGCAEPEPLTAASATARATGRQRRRTSAATAVPASVC